MIIEKLNIEARGGAVKYAVCADRRETGDQPHEIARFDELDTATLVLRYMRGDFLNKHDTQLAQDAIKKTAAAPAVESREGDR